jgi:hypothetical protein
MFRLVERNRQRREFARLVSGLRFVIDRLERS